jgi:hypothetical protein
MSLRAESTGISDTGSGRIGHREDVRPAEPRKDYYWWVFSGFHVLASACGTNSLPITTFSFQKVHCMPAKHEILPAPPFVSPTYSAIRLEPSLGPHWEAHPTPPGSHPAHKAQIQLYVFPTNTLFYVSV